MRWFALTALVWASTALAKDVQIATSDGVQLHASWTGKGEKGIILIPDDKRTRQDWAFLAEKLSKHGFSVLTFDLRGMGDSDLGRSITEADYPKMVSDVQEVSAWLSEHGATSVQLIGARLGANLALNAASSDPSIKSIALLSPHLNIRGIKMSAALNAYGERPVLWVVGADDDVATRAATALDERALGYSEVEIVEQGGVGATLLNRSSTLEGTLMAWVNGSYEQKTMKDRASDLHAGEDNSTIETTGKKFGEQ